MTPNPGAALVDFYARLKRRGLLLVVAALILGVTLALLSPRTRTPLPIAPPANKLGVHLLLDDGRNAWPPDIWPEHLRYAAEAVGEWGFVTQLVRADDLNTEKWQMFMDLCAEYRLTPIIRLATIFDREKNGWTIPTPGLEAQYADFISALRWPSPLHYVVVGNEPNHGNEWGGRPDPAAYARFLKAVAEAVHAADPNARVLNAPLDNYTPHTGSQPFADGFYYMDADTFIDQMIAAQPDVFTHIDAWASHPYAPGFSAPPGEQLYRIDRLNDAAVLTSRTPPEGIFNRGVNSYRWELWKLSTYGLRPLPVFITETGWRHTESAHPNALDSGEGLPDAATIARYFELALRGDPNDSETGWTPWLNDPR
ncbi:MAG: hypothetical protein K8I30_10365, partial [Anaerolineae bacterium]|nr:hypothetical protein [Anaerolineae bacterium]